MKLTVDEPKCVGAGQCALIAPTSLITGKKGDIVVLLTEAPGDWRRQPLVPQD
ncbi:hypothetical protein [Streptomyces sp. NPDC050704]|uniref:ferredoxin n=1 Tax=Streptomyces sp. NPDC050704 TaxID=3157219 RepID=UPI00341C0EA7